MTATTVRFAPGAVSQGLRLQVRDRLERRYLRLLDFERPALLQRFDDGEKAATVGRAIAITDYEIAAIQHHLGTEHDAHPDGGVCSNCCVLLDQGDGPQWLLLAALPEEGLPVIASDSALGRALIGAHAGQTVQFPTPSGARTADLIAVEA